MQAKKIKDNIYWVGAVDWDLRNFHGYITQRGTTYNAYLIVDEKITLIDTVKPNFFDEMLKRISSVVNPEKIDYIVSNHVEMDHSGSLPKIMDIAKNAEVITSPKGKQGLEAHYGNEFNFKTVKTGDTLKLGNNNMQFVLTPMVHWPDNMVGYLPEKKVLFSNDAFGQHIASSEIFDKEEIIQIIYEEAEKYYANIVLPYSTQVVKALSQTEELDINIIAPSHGVIWKSHAGGIIEKYKSWSANETEDTAVIIYDTMWNSTEKIAYAVQSAFYAKNISTKMCNIKTNHISDIMKDILKSKYICVGSPTLNNNMLPSIAGFLTYLKGLAPKNRIGLAFGSYGWGGQSIGQVEEILNDIGFEMLESIKVKYIPWDENLNEITEKIKKEIETKN